MGFIFYPKSKRFVKTLSLDGIDFQVPEGRVFVNEPLDSLKAKVKTFGLDYVQLRRRVSLLPCGGQIFGGESD